MSMATKNNSFTMKKKYRKFTRNLSLDAKDSQQKEKKFLEILLKLESTLG